MSNGFQFLDIILLGMVAAFVVLRLRNVLGRRGGYRREKTREQAATGETASEESKVIALPERKRRAAGENAEAPEGPEGVGEAANGARIRAADPGFDAATFLGGAKAAYEMVVVAFARGDRAALKPLLSSEVFKDFSAAIKQREARQEKQETTFVGMKSADIVGASLQGRIAEVTVRFVSELINATRDAGGNVVSGDPGAVEEVTDVWTFARDVRSSDPNWTLIATSAPA